MEHMGGQGNLLLTCCRRSDGVEIMRVQTADRVVVLPEEVWGLPVAALGSHAFTPGRPAAEGKQVRISSGPEAEIVEENAKIQQIHLPHSLHTVGDYAFYNCFSLKELRLCDSIKHWGGGALMNCRALDTIHIRLSDERAEVLHYFADELSRELDVTLVDPDGETARLIFPEYVEDYEENTPAKHFDYHIYGAGYPYHHCFWRKCFQIKEYDALWRTLLGMEHDPACALRLAYWRLRYPKNLSAEAEADYLAYLRTHAAEAVSWLLEERDARGLSWLLSCVKPERESLAAGLEQARRLGQAEAVALLLEARHRLEPAGGDQRFKL